MRNAFNVCIMYHAWYICTYWLQDASPAPRWTFPKIRLIYYNTRQSKFNFTLNTTAAKYKLHKEGICLYRGAEIWNSLPIDLIDLLVFVVCGCCKEKNSKWNISTTQCSFVGLQTANKSCLGNKLKIKNGGHARLAGQYYTRLSVQHCSRSPVQYCSSFPV